MTRPGLATQPESGLSRGRIGWEVAIVLALGLGQSAIYSIVAFIDLLTRKKPLSEQSTTIIQTLSDREIFNLMYQLLGNVFALAPVLLVCFLLWSSTRPRLGRLGIDAPRPGADVIRGLALALMIGIPGIALYLGGRALGINVGVNPSGLDHFWWTIPVLVLSAVRAGLQEEVVLLGYLFTRLGEAKWGRWQIIVATAVLRGSYHLYQGWGGFVGNMIMGLVFGWLFSRSRRVWPFVIAHAIIDAAVFIGYPWAVGSFPELFSIPQ